MHGHTPSQPDRKALPLSKRLFSKVGPRQKAKANPKIREGSPFWMSDLKKAKQLPGSELATRVLAKKDPPRRKSFTVTDSKGEKTTSYLGTGQFMHHKDKRFGR